MNWTSIGENIISNTISGLLVVAISGFFGFLIYVFGIKGKENNHNATERKEKIYIPLKDELQKIALFPDDIWKRITCPELLKAIEKDDEIGLSEDLYKKSQVLLELIDEYHGINLYNVVGDMLFSHFVDKYEQLYGCTKYKRVHWEECLQEEFEYDEWMPEICDFRENIYMRKVTEFIFENTKANEESYNERGEDGPTKEYLTHLCAAVLPKMEKKYDGIKWDSVKCELLENKKITPAEYIMKDYEFFDEFEKQEQVQKKGDLLDKIRENAHDLHEDVSMKIRFIVRHYESE